MSEAMGLTAAEVIRLTRGQFPAAAAGEIRVEPILKGGSDRRYFRLSTEAPAGDPCRAMVFMRYTAERSDNLGFVFATEILSRHGVAVPRILAHNREKMYLWSEDAGSVDLWDLRDAPWKEREPYYVAALGEAAAIHRIREEELAEAERGRLQPIFDRSLYQWEQDYFFRQFASRYSTLAADELEAVRADGAFRRIAEELAALPRFLVHRDFQSQNVIIHPAGGVRLIDYQGLRPGRPEYDVASLLLDPYAEIDPAARADLILRYREMRSGPDWEWSDAVYAKCACQRLMQALGAYGYLGNVLGKEAFFEHIPVAAERLREVVRSSGILRELIAVLKLRDNLP